MSPEQMIKLENCSANLFWPNKIKDKWNESHFWKDYISTSLQYNRSAQYIMRLASLEYRSKFEMEEV